MNRATHIVRVLYHLALRCPFGKHQWHMFSTAPAWECEWCGKIRYERP